MQVQFRAPGRAFSLVSKATPTAKRRLIFVAAAALISVSGLVLWRFPGLVGSWATRGDQTLIASWGFIVGVINIAIAIHIAIPIPSIIGDLRSAEPDLRAWAERTLSSPRRTSIYFVYNPFVTVLLGALVLVFVSRIVP